MNSKTAQKRNNNSDDFAVIGRSTFSRGRKEELQRGFIIQAIVLMSTVLLGQGCALSESSDETVTLKQDIVREEETYPAYFIEDDTGGEELRSGDPLGELQEYLAQDSQDSGDLLVEIVSTDEATSEEISRAKQGDAPAYAKLFGTDLEQAKRRLALQPKIGKVVRLLEEIHEDRFAGAWIENTPEFKVVVRLTGNQKVSPWMNSIELATNLPVNFQYDAKSTLSETLEVIERASFELENILPNLSSIHVDVKTGEIVVSVTESQGDHRYTVADLRDELSGETSLNLQNLLDRPLRVDRTVGWMAEQAIRGGALASGCTVGFTVGGGFITAAHCANSQFYLDYFGSYTTPYYMWGIRDGDQDIQMHVTSGHTLLAQFFANYVSSTRSVSSSTGRSSQIVGGFTCHRGSVTGYSCGTITTKNLQPAPGSLCGGSCSAVWIQVEGPSLACANGDSGGPWFLSNSAYGLHKLGISSGTGAGQCSKAAYMASNYFYPAVLLLN